MVGSTGGYQYDIASWWRKLVADYTGLNFFEVANLDYLQYLVWRRDAYIYMLSQTEEGRKYLDNAYRMEQTKPDREKLRSKLGRKEEAPDGG